MTQRIILDCDTGIDDTLALLYLVASADSFGCADSTLSIDCDVTDENQYEYESCSRESIDVHKHGDDGSGESEDPHVRLMAVVSTFGNVTERQAAINNRTLLDAAGLPDVPVFRGVPKPSFDTSTSMEYEVDEGCERFHGTNGWGGAVLSLPASVKRGEIFTSGVEIEARAVREYGHDVTIIATGPLTNIDSMLKKYPELAQRLHLVIMGGALTQHGNCYNLISETNIINDPEAADRVFHSGADITVIGIDVTHKTLMTRRHIETFARYGIAGDFIQTALDYYVSANEESDPVFLEGSPLHDPLAVAAALDSSLVSCFPINLMVDLEGPQRGRTVGDPRLINKPADHVRVALDVDRQRFLKQWETRTIHALERINRVVGA